MPIAIGIDPGVTSGICVLEYDMNRSLVTPILMQVNEAGFTPILNFLLSSRQGAVVAIEKFVTGNSAGTKGKNADVTRELVTVANTLGELAHCHTVIRQASDVKLWASDKRLQKAGILTDSNRTSVRHSLDAGRHALYAAVADLHMPDPLARK